MWSIYLWIKQRSLQAGAIVLALEVAADVISRIKTTNGANSHNRIEIGNSQLDGIHLNAGITILRAEKVGKIKIRIHFQVVACSAGAKQH